MRSSIIGIYIIILFVLVTVSIVELQRYSSMKYEVEALVNDAIYQTELQLYEEKDSITSDFELRDAFIHNIKDNKFDNRKYTVNFYGYDYKKGMLDVEVVYEYTNPFGNPIQFNARRTMIIDKSLFPKEE